MPRQASSASAKLPSITAAADSRSIPKTTLPIRFDLQKALSAIAATRRELSPIRTDYECCAKRVQIVCKRQTAAVKNILVICLCDKTSRTSARATSTGHLAYKELCLDICTCHHKTLMSGTPLIGITFKDN